MAAENEVMLPLYEDTSFLAISNDGNAEQNRRQKRSFGRRVKVAEQQALHKFPSENEYETARNGSSKLSSSKQQSSLDESRFTGLADRIIEAGSDNKENQSASPNCSVDVRMKEHLRQPLANVVEPVSKPSSKPSYEHEDWIAVRDPAARDEGKKASVGRRKTPSELRQEQLKRIRLTHDGEPPVVSVGSAPDLKKGATRLVNTRVADIFVATKPFDRPKSTFDKSKDTNVILNKDLQETRSFDIDHSKDNKLPFKYFRKLQEENSKAPVSPDVFNGKTPGNVDVPSSLHTGPGDVSSCGRFRDVTQISTSVRSKGLACAVDMAEAIKGMATIGGGSFGDQSTVLSSSHQDITNGNGSNKLLLLSVAPLDLSLKHSARFLSPGTLHW